MLDLEVMPCFQLNHGNQLQHCRLTVLLTLVYDCVVGAG